MYIIKIGNLTSNRGRGVYETSEELCERRSKYVLLSFCTTPMDITVFLTVHHYTTLKLNTSIRILVYVFEMFFYST